jgi:hypothetical protein
MDLLMMQKEQVIYLIEDQPEFSKKDHDDQWLNSARQSGLVNDWYEKDLKDNFGINKDDSDTKQWGSKEQKLELYPGKCL